MVDSESIDIDINKVPLEELIIVIGGVLYSGAELEEIETNLCEQVNYSITKADI